jgi:hypothetical protein
MVVIQGGVWDCPPMSMDCMVNALLVEEGAFSCDVLWSAKLGAARAGGGFGWIRRTEQSCV